MHAIVIFESLTGHTAAAAAVIAEELNLAGITTTASPITAIDYAALSAAELVMLGSWVDGLLFVGQKPGRAGRMAKLLPAISHKRCVVFCTYAIDSGKTLEKLTAMAERHGAEVLGGLAINRRDIEGGARDLVQRTLDILSAA